MSGERRARLLAVLARCHQELIGTEVDVAALPLDASLADLDDYGVVLDSIQLLELVVMLEDAFGCELDLTFNDDDWTTYRWGDFLRDLEAALPDQLT